jgi:hypothetical protein
VSKWERRRQTGGFLRNCVDGRSIATVDGYSTARLIINKAVRDGAPSDWRQFDYAAYIASFREQPPEL